MATGRVPTTANSPLTAKGDLFGYSTTQARVPVGNDGETLVADSSASTGLRWQSARLQNPLLNSSFAIWQRGTSGAGATNSTTGFWADRWQGWRGGFASGQTISRQATGDTTNLPFIQYCARVQRDSGNTSTATYNLTQNIETSNSIPLAGRTIVYSFYARRGANYSATSNNLTTYLVGGTGTDQNLLSGFTGQSTVATGTHSLTTTWQRFQVSVTIGSTITQLALRFECEPTGTAGAADYFEVTGVQIELGAVATSYAPYAATLAGELAACQRYYYLHVSGSAQAISGGWNYTSSDMRTYIKFPVTMRGNPTLSATSGTNYYTFERNGAGDDFNSFSGVRFTTNGATLNNSTEISGTAGQAGELFTSNAASFIAFSAEL